MSYFHAFASNAATTSSVVSAIEKAESVIDFYDEILTSANQTNVVVCCFPETGTTRNETCGKGISCAAQCSALEAKLCPSGNCTDDPRDWQLPLTDRAFSVSTLPSSSLKKCSPSCRVQKRPICCYHHQCYAKRKKSCDWFNYLSGTLNSVRLKENEKSFAGKSCPRPGTVPHGQWVCRTRDEPILGTTFLDGEAQTYTGL